MLSVIALSLLVTASQAILATPASLQAFPSAAIDLKPFFNNKAASSDGSADFDGQGGSFDSQFLPSGVWTHDNISYNLPSSWGSENDNVIASGQVLPLENPAYVHEAHFLFAGDGNSVGFAATLTLNFADNTTQNLTLQGKGWWSWPLLNKGVIQTPYNIIKNGTTLTKNLNATQIYQWSTSIPSEQKLSSITLSSDTSPRLHFFAINFSPSSDPSQSSGAALAVRRVRFTNRWETVNNVRAQAVEVTLANLLPGNTLSANTSLTFETHHRDIGTWHSDSDAWSGQSSRSRGSNASMVVKDNGGTTVGTSDGWAASPLIEEWTPDASVLAKHETPAWWNKAKYGILQVTMRLDVVYDDFIPKFTASKFNASQWMDLFDRAGAKYFVLVTKHHDGYALFDAGNTTHRSSVYSGPQRDLVAELFATAAREKPDIHRGTYYSLPEWFSPDYAKYGFGEWPGGLAHNVFNESQIEPYTGRLDISDYIDDLQLPHMLQLAEQYETEIMWCDIGGPNKTIEFAAQYYNLAFQKGRQVTINNRCGEVPDFVTPEYSTFNTIEPDSWESSEGMDPFSYGYNSATNASQYKNGTTLIRTLVDIVSKGGNFLIDIGPTAEGEIIAPMADNLLDAGAWLQHSGECVYDTVIIIPIPSHPIAACLYITTQDFSFQGSEDINVTNTSTPARFTRTADTFCIVAFDRPGKTESSSLTNDSLSSPVTRSGSSVQTSTGANRHRYLGR
ncbi:hypothetical protein AAF712_009912 [Marasmius tenuissimus]|uniref:alpha-L-fucosidase n=1 Tax=Marasmius tenuissimus TaxID=585030 RepID=A0ABR2ZPX6_9AGAR